MVNSAKQSSAGAPAGLLRRFATRNDESPLQSSGTAPITAHSAKQSSAGAPAGLLRRFATRNDESSLRSARTAPITAQARLNSCDRPGAGRAANDRAGPSPRSAH